MAVDTENKRRSAFNACLFSVMPVPDGTIDCYDRIHVAGYYAGLLTVVPYDNIYFDVYFDTERALTTYILTTASETVYVDTAQSYEVEL